MRPGRRAGTMKSGLRVECDTLDRARSRELLREPLLQA
jgi:hypothetical protein